jgi:cell division transport system ATP-binding protein
LVADEPTGNLDAETAMGIVDLLQKINHIGTTVLLVSHDQALVNHIHRRVIVLDGGSVVSDQPVGRYKLGL